MKVLKWAIIAVVVGGIALLSVGCPGTATESTQQQQQVVTVQRGNLEVDITASGNLSLSRTEDLAFDMAGIVDQVNVEVGDSVKQGEVLATLDTSLRDENLTQLESSVLQAEISQKNTQLALDKAEDQTVTLVTGDIIFSNNYDDEQIAILKLQNQQALAKLADAQKALADAQNASPEVIAPFDGFVTAVNVAAGDAGVSGNGVPKGTVAVTIADPTKFEANILVSEMDIFQVKLGQDATVQVDAMPTLNVPAKVTFISPTATIQSGVVNYSVKVELESLEDLMQQRQGATTPSGSTTPGQAGSSTDQPAATAPSFQLRQGLTVTVSIIMQQKSDVLLVPNGAITTQGRQAYVQVVAADGAITQQAITTGISNWQYTEVTDGLAEGEKVVVTQGAASTATTTPQGPPGGGIFFGRG
jgi:RND family efflux transporter MFP subunit